MDRLWRTPSAVMGLEVMRLLKIRERSHYDGLDEVVKAFTRALCGPSPRITKTIGENSVDEIFPLDSLDLAQGAAGCGAFILREPLGAIVRGRVVLRL